MCVCECGVTMCVTKDVGIQQCHYVSVQASVDVCMCVSFSQASVALCCVCVSIFLCVYMCVCTNDLCRLFQWQWRQSYHHSGVYAYLWAMVHVCGMCVCV